MSLYRHPKSAYWWCRFTIGGREVRESTGTKVRKDAEEYEHRLRARYWRASHLGEEHHTWKEAAERWLRERAGKRSLERDQRIFREYREIESVSLHDFSLDMLNELRTAREKTVAAATVNREFALIRSVLNRAVSPWRWLEHAPAVPMVEIEPADPRWLTRAQFVELLKHLPAHAADLARFAVATGIRRSNITGLTWDRVDLEERFAYIPGSQAKGKRGIPVPLNEDAVEVLKRREGKHATHVFTFRGQPITQVATRRWREAAKAAGIEGLRFHDLRHTWASWQAQSGTPLYVLRELGGWRTDAMVKRYSHLGAGDLSAYASRSLVERPSDGMKVGTPAKPKARRHK